MIELGVVDLSADGRRRLVSLIERWSWSLPDSRVSVPRISVNPLSPEEVRFHGSLDVCVIGPELVGCDAAFVNTLRQQLPDKVLLCVLDSRLYSFSLVEQLGRLGVDDVLVDSASSDEFFRRILLLQRRIQTKNRGRLAIVDSARGGVGKTFLTAALAEGWFARGERVCIVDCDVFSQDLTRFLQVRPCVNEALRVLIDQRRVVTSETVGECVREVWFEELNFVCMAPPAGGDDALFATPQAQRGFVAVLEALVHAYDRVVVDTSGLMTAAKNSLFQVCDDLLFVVNRDATASYANRQALSLIAGFLRPDATLTVLLNDNGVGSASHGLLKNEVLVLTGRPVAYVPVPRSKQAALWVCSGHTPYRFLRRDLEEVFNVSGVVAPQHSSLSGVCGRLFQMLKGVSKHVLNRRSSWRRMAAKESASKEPWGAQPALVASPLLGVEQEASQDGVLVSKPVLLG